MKPLSAIEAYDSMLDYVQHVEGEVSQFLRTISPLLEDYVFDLKGTVRLRRKLFNAFYKVSYDHVKTLDDIRYVCPADAEAIFSMANANLRTDDIARTILRSIVRARMQGLGEQESQDSRFH